MEISARVADCMQRARSVGWDLGLSSIKALLYELNNPQDLVPCVHVTGTNGKGSICAFLNSICIESGIKVGRYTSPAVISEYERYTINNAWIEEADYYNCLEAIAIASDIVANKGFRHPSVFEIETALAFLYFANSQCDLMIIEVGMGGLLDATNVISNPLICAFGSIGVDHTAWLGDSLIEITKNKAGIIKPNAFIVSAIQPIEAEAVLKDTAKANLCEIIFAQPVKNMSLSLEGSFQKQNAAVAIECARILKLKGFSVSEEAIKTALTKASWPFRFEHICGTPDIVLDGAHNFPAIRELRNTLISNYPNENKTFIISVLKDKDFDKMFKLILPLAKDIIVVESSNPRALDIDSLYNTAKKNTSQNVYKALSISDAVSYAGSLSNQMIVCFGTFTFLNDIKDALVRRFCK